MAHAQCWAHAWCYFGRAGQSEPAAVAEALETIGALYRIEAEIRENSLEGRAKLAYRSRHSLAVVEAFFGWVAKERKGTDLFTDLIR